MSMDYETGSEEPTFTAENLEAMAVSTRILALVRAQTEDDIPPAGATDVIQLYRHRQRIGSYIVNVRFNGVGYTVSPTGHFQDPDDYDRLGDTPSMPETALAAYHDLRVWLAGSVMVSQFREPHAMTAYELWEVVDPTSEVNGQVVIIQQEQRDDQAKPEQEEAYADRALFIEELQVMLSEAIDGEDYEAAQGLRIMIYGLAEGTVEWGEDDFVPYGSSVILKTEAAEELEGLLQKAASSRFAYALDTVIPSA